MITMKFQLKNKSFDVSGSKKNLFWFTMCPAMLKAHSAGTDVAGIAKYFLARFRQVAKDYLCN